MSGEELMRTIVAAFTQSDLRPLLDALHEDVVWKSATNHEGLFRFHGEYRKISGVIDVLSNISKDYTFYYMKPKEILVVGDVVWGYFDVELRFDDKGNVAEPKIIQLDMAIRWRLRDGKIIEHVAFFDTAHLLVEQLNLDVTAHRQAAESLAQLNETLEARVAERTDALAQEIRHHEQTQAKLRESQERYALVEAAANDGIWDVNVLTGEIYLSPRWKAILGYADDELPNLQSSFFDCIHPDDVAVVSERWRAMLADESNPFSYEVRLRHKNGDYCWVISRGIAIRDGAGQIVRRVGTITDVTERKRSAEMLLRTQRMEAVGQLTAGIAHDFNNLLAVISGGLEFIAGAAGRGLTAEREMIEASMRATQRGADLVKRLLAFSRQSPLKPEPTLIDQLVLDTLRLLQRTLGEQTEIVTRLDAQGAIVFADGNQLVNAFLNLAVNARDAMPEGGQLIITTVCKPALRAAEDGRGRWPTGEEVCITVADSGVGMTEEVRNRAFEPFFTTKPDGLGSGLGLSMVMGFVEQTGGYIEIDSAVGCGTTVTICLPRIDAVSQPDEINVIAGLGTEPMELTVLLVEDDPDVRTVTAAQLKQLGYKVYGVGTGTEALDLIASPAEIDIMLTDMVLPGGVDGMTLLKEASRTRPRMGLVCMSGYDPTQGRRKWLNIQNIAFLEKPFSRAQLAQALEETMAR